MVPSIKHVLVAIIAVFAPAEAVLCTVLCLVLLDFATGVGRAIKDGEKITSGGFKKTVIKLLVYESAVSLAYLVGTYLTGPLIPVLNLIGGMIGLTELKSILENINDISGGSLLTSIIQAIQKSSSAQSIESELGIPSNPSESPPEPPSVT